jgi:hypothetical protein
MGVAEDATKMLLEMAATGEGDKRGHLDFDGPGLSDGLGWPPPRVNDAVRFLWDRGWIDLFRQGGGPYNFTTISLSVEGRSQADVLAHEWGDLPTPAPPSRKS